MKSAFGHREIATRSADTRRRLLEAAGEVFAEKGFRTATIHTICRRAGANIAAVHYHFGDKERLYGAVIEYADRCATEPRAIPGDDGSAAPPAQRLQRHVGSFLSRLFDRGRPAWHAKLMAREMVDPTAALDRLVRDKMRANHRQLGGIVRDLMGAPASAEAVRLSVLSIIAQCVFYRHSAPVIARLYPDLVMPQDVGRIADHITRFSLAAIRGLRPTEPIEQPVAAPRRGDKMATTRGGRFTGTMTDPHDPCAPGRPRVLRGRSEGPPPRKPTPSRRKR